MTMIDYRQFVCSKVKDIYGGDYAIMGLPGDVPASSFGKAARTSREDRKGLSYILDECNDNNMNSL